MSHIRSYTGLIPQPVRFGLRRIVFKGSSQSCVLCGNGVRGFRGHGGGFDVLDRRKVVGGMRREKDRCPICHGCDRTRMMMLYLDQEIGVGQHPLKILHVAPDFGLYLWLKRQPNVIYVGSDIDATRYRHIKNTRSADLTNTPFETNEFDVIICSHVLEHIPDDSKAMCEMLRILKPGGRTLALVPLATDGKAIEEEPSINDPAEQERRFGQWDHVRIYSRDGFLKRLAESGFDVSTYAPFDEAPSLATELNLNPLEILPIGRKPLLT